MPTGIAAFDETDPAPEFQPLPAGIYTARVVSGSVTQTRKGDDAYRMAFEVNEGEHRGRRIFRVWTFGDRARAYSKRDLAAFGLTTAKQLLEPYPPRDREIYVRLIVALQRGDDGIERNDIKRIDIIRTENAGDAEFLLDPPAAEGGPA